MGILIVMGDIFEGSTDLTVLPCSAKGSVSSATVRWQHAFGLKAPSDLGLSLALGTISDPYPFPGPKHVTQHYCFAASVLNDHSSPATIRAIGSKLGSLTSERADIKIVETPLLGTGAGGLATETAGRSLAKGFAETAASDANLFIFVYDRERFDRLTQLLSEEAGIARRVWNSIGLRPGAFGVSVDIKKLLRPEASDDSDP